jgi:hypothetical protein
MFFGVMLKKTLCFLGFERRVRAARLWIHSTSSLPNPSEPLQCEHVWGMLTAQQLESMSNVRLET